MLAHAINYFVSIRMYGRSLIHWFKLAIIGVNGKHAESAHVELDLEDVLHVADLLDLGHLSTGGIGWTSIRKITVGPGMHCADAHHQTHVVLGLVELSLYNAGVAPVLVDSLHL